jgi:hypothetical protein
VKAITNEIQTYTCGSQKLSEPFTAHCANWNAVSHLTNGCPTYLKFLWEFSLLILCGGCAVRGLHSVIGALTLLEIYGMFTPWTMKLLWECWLVVELVLGSLWFTPRKIKVTMKVEVSKRHVWRPTQSTNMFQHVLHWKRQKKWYGRKRQGHVAEKCCHDKILIFYIIIYIYYEGGGLDTTLPTRYGSRGTFFNIRV